MSAARRHIGIFGGSFDPVHNAHLALARAATGQLPLDELRWVPSGQPPHKAGHVSAARHREAMVRLAIDATSGCGDRRWRLEPYELGRAEPSFTLDTVRALRDREPDVIWYLVLGRDQYDGLPTWHGHAELLALVTLAVANRPGLARPAGLRDFAHRNLDLAPMDVSSTVIRERLAAGRAIDDLVPAAVAGYIERHHLYTAEDPGS